MLLRKREKGFWDNGLGGSTVYFAASPPPSLVGFVLLLANIAASAFSNALLMLHFFLNSLPSLVGCIVIARTITRFKASAVLLIPCITRVSKLLIPLPCVLLLLCLCCIFFSLPVLILLVVMLVEYGIVILPYGGSCGTAIQRAVTVPQLIADRVGRLTSYFAIYPPPPTMGILQGTVLFCITLACCFVTFAITCNP